MINIKEKLKKNIKGKILVYQVPTKHLNEDSWINYNKPQIFTNVITDEICEFLVGKLLEKDPIYKITHMYGQYGTSVNFPEGGGPYITPDESDKVIDLDNGSTIFTTNAEIGIKHRTSFTQENQSTYSNNILSNIAVFSDNDNQVYIGFGLVCEIPGKKLLLSHVATEGILKRPSVSIVVVWDWTFTNV